MEKFIYVFSESDRDLLLAHGYTMIQEPKSKKRKTSTKAKKTSEESPVEEKEPVKTWIFENKSTRDIVLDDIDIIVYSNILTF